MLVLLAADLPLGPWDLVRVDQPDAPGADATSAYGSVLLAPPEAGRWKVEPVPEVDAWHGEEASTAMNAVDWRLDGATGQGVKVAVFDVQWFGAEVDPDVLGPVETHDCYTTPTCLVPMDTTRPRFAYEEGNHGYGCAQTLHDVAPDAELHLVRVNGQTTLENAVDWAIREHVDVVSMSMSFFNTSFYDGSGALSEIADRLRQHDILFVVSSGNYARGHWMGTWSDVDGDHRLDHDIALDLGPGKTNFYVTWDQFRDCGASDIDVRVVDDHGNIFGRGEDRQDVGAAHCEPVERVSADIPEEGSYHLELRLIRGVSADLHLDVIATDIAFAGSIAEGSGADPQAAASVFSVGAVKADGYFDNGPEPFSSRGPTADGRQKPDIAGPDGLSVDAYGAVGFYGTSAATPAVAGAIALILSDDPGLTPIEASRRLQDWALSDNIQWQSRDEALGAGKAHLPERDDMPDPCGRGPLMLPLYLLPASLCRRRHRR
jgi:subtilisin family serine protease